jgi:hypothetical protein
MSRCVICFESKNEKFLLQCGSEALCSACVKRSESEILAKNIRCLCCNKTLLGHERWASYLWRTMSLFDLLSTFGLILVFAFIHSVDRFLALIIIITGEYLQSFVRCVMPIFVNPVERNFDKFCKITSIVLNEVLWIFVSINIQQECDRETLIKIASKIFPESFMLKHMGQLYFNFQMIFGGLVIVTFTTKMLILKDLINSL